MVKLNRFVKSLACLGVMIALAGCATPQNQSTAPIDDSAITAKVKAALSSDPSLKKSAIDVRTYKGEVVLKGSVETQQGIYKAAEIVNRVEGVTSLYNDLAVK